MAHLLNVSWKPNAEAARQSEAFPFSVPVVRTLDRLALDTAVTFFVGENGSGKSTLLEAIAVAAELPTIGAAEALDDASLDGPRTLAAALRLAWTRRTRRGFFLRAEDFFGYLRRKAREDARVRRESRERLLEEPPPERVDEWRGSVHADEVAAAEFLARYDGRSHGESFLDLFGARLGDGLYLLDEPETPLSPHRQLTLLALLGDATKRGAQFVVATHSPILLAFPGARIYDFDALPVRATTYDALPHVTLTRDFLNAPERYVRHLAG
jgi:predicted ATPase